MEQTANVATLALSVILQAVPFILLGVFASSLIRYLVREDWIAKLTPKNAVAGVIFGSLLGLFIPVCDCGVLPVARGLFRKGVSMHTALAYLLTAPVINPVVILATAMAFQWNWHLVALRVVSTFIVGATTALFAGSMFSHRAFTDREWHRHENESSKISIHQLLIHVWDILRPKRSDEHPTMKPVELVARALVNSSNEGDLVLDLFGGSGTTILAAAQTGRVCC